MNIKLHAAKSPYRMGFGVEVSYDTDLRFFGLRVLFAAWTVVFGFEKNVRTEKA